MIFISEILPILNKFKEKPLTFAKKQQHEIE